MGGQGRRRGGGGGDYKTEDELCGAAPYLTRGRPGWGPVLSRGRKLCHYLASEPPPQPHPLPPPTPHPHPVQQEAPEKDGWQEGRARLGGINNKAGGVELGSCRTVPRWSGGGPWGGRGPACLGDPQPWLSHRGRVSQDARGREDSLVIFVNIDSSKQGRVGLSEPQSPHPCSGLQGAPAWALPPPGVSSTVWGRRWGAVSPQQALVLCPGETDPDAETEAKGGRGNWKDRERDREGSGQRDTER